MMVYGKDLLWYNLYMFGVKHEANGWGTGGQWDGVSVITDILVSMIIISPIW